MVQDMAVARFGRVSANFSMSLSAGGGGVDGLDAADEVGRRHVVLVASPLELTCGQILFLL